VDQLDREAPRDQGAKAPTKSGPRNTTAPRGKHGSKRFADLVEGEARRATEDDRDHRAPVRSDCKDRQEKRPNP
jgi:hypothetical protein